MSRFPWKASYLPFKAAQIADKKDRNTLNESNVLLPAVKSFVPPYEHLLNLGGSMNRYAADQVMPGVIRLVPGAGYDAPAAAGRPFLPVRRPESQTTFGIDIPFAVTRIVVQRIGDLLGGWAERNRLARTIFGALFAGHAEFMSAEGNGLVDLQRQIGGDRFEAHINAEFRGEDVPVAGELSDASVNGHGHHQHFRPVHPQGFAVHGVISQEADEIGQLNRDVFEAGVGFRNGRS